MAIDPSRLAGPLLVAVLIAFALYRRVRTTVGRQRLSERGLITRMVLFGIVSVVLLLSPVVTSLAVEYSAAGALAGALLGVLALRHTKFETTPEGQFYTPHLYIGLAVMALFVGRIIYRLAGQLPGMQSPAPLAATAPMTLGIFFVLAAYYVSYSAGLVLKSRQLKALT